MSEQEEMIEGKAYPELIEELMFQVFVQGEDPCGNLLGLLVSKINKLETNV